VRPALEHPNVTLLTNARVVKLETNGSGNEVSEVVVEQGGETVRIAGDLVVVACGAANTAKLLLASANDHHANGLANGSDQVGRNYMFHDSVAVLALSREENRTVFQKTLGLNDFYFGSDDFELDLNPGHLIHRFAYMKNDIPVAGVAHQAGTCRFGTDPASPVLNTDCRAHEVDNLYVVDTSVFPSIGAVNPALTAMANSLRVGDHLLERMGARQLAATA
jgi:choline dehydrogenase-like flavoprotein